MKDWGHPSRANYIIVVHGPQALTDFGGKGIKSWSNVIRGRGHDTHTWHMDDTQCGASMYSNHIVTFCFPWDSLYQLPLKISTDPDIRSCRNIIRIYGIAPSQYHSMARMKLSSHPTRPNWVGTLYGQLVYQWDGTLCSLDQQYWILMPDFGICRIQMDELEKLKGLSDSRYTNMSHGVLLHNVEQHV